MRKSKVETAQTRRRIVDVAGQQFRLNGIHATGLNELMSEAGLTRGGFYRHFESKDQLVAETCTAGIAALIERLEDAAARIEASETSQADESGEAGERNDRNNRSDRSDRNNRSDAFRTIVGRYVSANHRDDAFGGCPLAAMASELARADEGTRTAASAGFDALVQMIEKRLTQTDPEAAHAEAVFTMAAMIGAVTMSRVMVDRDASARVLQSVKQHLETL